MTKEQEKAIYRLNLGKNIPISNDCCIVNIQDIETVLSMLEEKDKEIQFQNDINKTELDRHNKTEKNLKGIINKQNKIIDLYIDNIMTYQQVKTIRKMCCPSCPIGEKACTYSGIHRNCIKHENKAKELLNK